MPAAPVTSDPSAAPPPRGRQHPLTRSLAGMLGLGFLGLIFALCVLTLPFTLRSYDEQSPAAGYLPPSWVARTPDQAARARAAATLAVERAEAAAQGVSVETLRAGGFAPPPAALAAADPAPLLGTDLLGRDLLVRCLVGGGISLGVGLAAALMSVVLGTVYGMLAGYLGGRVDSVMMRIVDVLYGLPYILLVVLLAVASDSLLNQFVSRSGARDAWMLQRAAELAVERGQHPSAARALLAEPAVAAQVAAEANARDDLKPRVLGDGARTVYDLVTLLVAIGGVSWLTMARVVRGQVLSLKAQPFVEAARALGVPTRRIFLRHLLPNLVGPIVVYATLTVPQAILQESFLSFLGIGVRPPLPSWGNLAADGLVQLNPVESNWWLLLFPCLLLASTLLALNFVGEGLREALDPKRSRR